MGGICYEKAVICPAGLGHGAQPDGEMVMYDGGGDDFTALQNETTFDYKKLGAQMLTNGFDLDAALADLDAKWGAARAKLGIQ